MPQIHSEGTAAILLQQIKDEKQRLVKEGKLKKSAIVDSVIFRGDDNKYYEQVGGDVNCIDDEIPFEIPERWAWCRLGELAELYTGNSISESEKRAKYTNVEGVCYIGTKDVSFNHKIDYENGIAVPPKYISKFKIAPAESILLCVEGGSAGKKIAFTHHDVCFGNKLCCFAFFAPSSADYEIIKDFFVEVRYSRTFLRITQFIFVETDNIQNIRKVHCRGNQQLLECAAHIPVFRNGKDLSGILAVNQNDVVASVHKLSVVHYGRRGFPSEIFGIQAMVCPSTLFSIIQPANTAKFCDSPGVWKQAISFNDRDIGPYLLIILVVRPYTAATKVSVIFLRIIDFLCIFAARTNR